MAMSPVPLSKVREAGDFVFLSGALPYAEDGSLPEGIAAQTDLTLSKISQTLADYGLTMSDIVSCTIHLADRAHFYPMNEVYAKHFPGPLPTRTTVQAVLMGDALIEITTVAYRPGRTA